MPDSAVRKDRCEKDSAHPEPTFEDSSKERDICKYNTEQIHTKSTLNRDNRYGPYHRSPPHIPSCMAAKYQIAEKYPIGTLFITSVDADQFPIKKSYAQIHDKRQTRHHEPQFPENSFINAPCCHK